jgi:hypothetical protein
MRLDLLPASAWDRTNDLARQRMSSVVSASEYEVRCYKGMAAGLLEVFNGTASFLSHKKTVGVIAGQTWAQESLLPHLLRESFQVKTFPVDFLSSPEAAADQIDSDMSCFLWPEDHPLTGQVFEADAFEEMLNKKRIFSIRISHHAFRTRTLNLRPYAVRLCSVSPDLTVAFLGARFKTPAWIAADEAWSADEIERKISAALNGAAEDERAVADFEGKLTKGWRPLLTAKNRVWDRAVIANADKSGDGVLHELSALLKMPLGVPGDKNAMETLHLCRWGLTMNELSWWQGCPSADLIRGSVILDVSVLSKAEVKNFFCG